MKTPTPLKTEPTRGHSIKVLSRDNVWYATITVQTGPSEFSAPYFVEAPSQTMLIELIRMIIPRDGRK